MGECALARTGRANRSTRFARNGGCETTTIVGRFLTLGRLRNQSRDAVDQIIRTDLGELAGDTEHSAAQLRRLEQCRQEVRTAHAIIGKSKRGIHPGALDGSFDLEGEIADGTGASRERS